MGSSDARSPIPDDDQRGHREGMQAVYQFLHRGLLRQYAPERMNEPVRPVLEEALPHEPGGTRVEARRWTPGEALAGRVEAVALDRIGERRRLRRDPPGGRRAGGEGGENEGAHAIRAWPARSAARSPLPSRVRRRRRFPDRAPGPDRRQTSPGCTPTDRRAPRCVRARARRSAPPGSAGAARAPAARSCARCRRTRARGRRQGPALRDRRAGADSSPRDDTPHQPLDHVSRRDT